MRTRFSELLDLELPVVQAPMAGVSTPELAAAVSNAGGLGSVAVGTMSAAQADEALRLALAPCNGRANVNVFTHARPVRDPVREAQWLAALAPLFHEYGAEPPESLQAIYPTFDDAPELLDVILSHRPAVVSFHFGLPASSSIQALKSCGVRLFATATSVSEAKRLVAAGIDVIVAQGYEAGGHRGTFSAEPDERLSTLTLLPRIAAAVNVPVLAAGGIMDGAGIAAALTLGASGVQMGSAFIDCPESAAGDDYRRLLRGEGRRTAMTASFSGRPARAIVNRLVQETEGRERCVPAYPVAYDAAKLLAAAAMARGSTELTPMWAGQGPVREESWPAGQLVRRVGEELEEALEAGLERAQLARERFHGGQPRGRLPPA